MAILKTHVPPIVLCGFAILLSPMGVYFAVTRLASDHSISRSGMLGVLAVIISYFLSSGLAIVGMQESWTRLKSQSNTSRLPSLLAILAGLIAVLLIVASAVVMWLGVPWTQAWMGD